MALHPSMSEDSTFHVNSAGFWANNWLNEWIESFSPDQKRPWRRQNSSRYMRWCFSMSRKECKARLSSMQGVDWTVILVSYYSHCFDWTPDQKQCKVRSYFSSWLGVHPSWQEMADSPSGRNLFTSLGAGSRKRREQVLSSIPPCPLYPVWCPWPWIIPIFKVDLSLQLNLFGKSLADILGGGSHWCPRSYLNLI